MLAVAVTEDADRVVVRLSGEADLSTRAVLAAELPRAASAAGTVELDIAGVRFWDTSCFAPLSALHAALDADGRTCRLVDVPPRTRRLIQLAGWTELLPPH